MSSRARQLLNALKRAPVAIPVYVVGMVSGLAAALAPDRDLRRAASRSRFIASWKRRVRKSIEAESGAGALEGEAVIGRVSDAAQDDEQLAQLREALLGLPKPLVATLLGNPASSFYVEPTAGPGASAHWHADIWYYPADLRRRVALAIHFENDRVTQIERIAGPEM